MIPTNSSSHLQLARAQLALSWQVSEPRADRRRRLFGGWA